MSALAQIDDLTISYQTQRGSLHAIDDINLSIRERECFGIIGESGCGKSTLLAALGMMLPPPANVESGNVKIDGKSIFTLNTNNRRLFRKHDIAFIFQEPLGTMDPTKTIESQLLSLIEDDDGKNQLRDRLTAVGLIDVDRVLASYPYQLSGGMGQRVAIAMALSGRPKLIIADEPTAALDASIRRDVMDMLVGQTSKIGASLILVSHDLASIEHYCDRICVMYAGRIVEVRDKVEFFNDPSHPYSKALLLTDPGHKACGDKIEELPGMPPILTEPCSHCAFAPRCSEASDRCFSVKPKLVNVPGGFTACIHRRDRSQEM